MSQSIGSTIGVLAVAGFIGILASVLWAALNGVFLLLSLLLPSVRRAAREGAQPGPFSVWFCIGVEILSGVLFALLLGWSCVKWALSPSVYAWPIWLLAWVVANVPLHMNARDVSRAAASGNAHSFQSSVILAIWPVRVVTMVVLAWMASISR